MSIPSQSLATPANRATDLQWPAPHHLRLIDNRPDGEAERAVVTLTGGEKLLGCVTAIDFEGQMLLIEPEAGPPRALAFDAFRSLFLSRPVELEALPMEAPPGALVSRPKRARRECTVQLKDGATIRVDVAAVLPRRAGLFLYVVSYADAVLRWFVPMPALQQYKLGDEPVAAQQPAAAPLREEQAANVSEFLDDGESETREEVEDALRRRKLSTQHLGDILVQDGLITPQQRDDALARQRGGDPQPLHEILCAMGAVTREVIRQAMVSQLGVPTVQLARFPFDPALLKMVTAELARKHRAMPLFRSEKRLAVALENPLSWQALHELEFFTTLKVDPCLASRADLDAAIEQHYGEAAGQEQVGHLLRQLQDKRGARGDGPTRPGTEADETIARLVNKIILDAHGQGVSDIHIESHGDDKPSRVRFRRDGALATYVEVPPEFRAALVQRIKTMAELDTSERRRPQDGRILFGNFGPRQFELGVLTMPTAAGLEDVVLRILATPRATSVDKLGLAPLVVARLKEATRRSYGLMLVCGPMGSGRTTTVHSLLASINTPERKIWTVEDPVEITQDGLCQVQVNPKLGLTFPEALRSFLRADPDVIMVGETRDAETARMVTAASLTGHLVFTTMHTGSAVESVLRLVDLEVDAFNLSDALIGVLGQRLVRRLCSCKQPHVATSDEIHTLAHEYCRETPLDHIEVAARWRTRYGDPNGAITLYSSKGCPQCEGSGYKGRLGVHELLMNSPAIKKAIQRSASPDELLQIATQEGMLTLEQDAIEKILQGDLDLKQVLASCR